MRILGVLFLALGIIATSCNKEEQWTSTENFVQAAYQEMSEDALGGHHRCYKVDFPVTVIFPDESTTEVNDREELLTTFKNWKNANPGVEERPTLEFPISVERQDGEVLEVNSKQEIRELRRECRQHNNGHRKCGKFARFIDNKCFSVQLPISLVMASGEIISIENRQDVRRLLRSWKADRPDEVPEISFPISVTLKESGETLEIADQDAFDTLVEECRE